MELRGSLSMSTETYEISHPDEQCVETSQQADVINQP
jgi:hypothetical protein